MKYCLFNITVAIIVAVVFAWTFVYLIPSVAVRFGYDEGKMMQAARANEYHKYLEHKGYVK